MIHLSGFVLNRFLFCIHQFEHLPLSIEERSSLPPPLPPFLSLCVCLSVCLCVYLCVCVCVSVYRFSIYSQFCPISWIEINRYATVVWKSLLKYPQSHHQQIVLIWINSHCRQQFVTVIICSHFVFCFCMYLLCRAPKSLSNYIH